MKRLKRIIVLLLNVILSLFSAEAQHHLLYTSEKELSSSLVTDIYQDRNNVIWISTEDGLNRYDGVKFKNYLSQPNKNNSLAHNYVRSLIEDDNGNLIIGTYKGLQLYDSATDSFSALATFQDGVVLDSFITHLFKRRNGEVIATGNQVCRVMVKDGVLYAAHLDLPFPSDLVEYGMEDNEGNLWFTRESDGIYKLKPDGSFTHYDDYEKKSAILYLCQGSGGEIVGGSPRAGVYIYDRKTDKFNIIEGSENLQVKRLYAADGCVYICTDGQGLKRIDMMYFPDFG